MIDKLLDAFTRAFGEVHPADATTPQGQRKVELAFENFGNAAATHIRMSLLPTTIVQAFDRKFLGQVMRDLFLQEWQETAPNIPIEKWWKGSEEDQTAKLERALARVYAWFEETYAPRKPTVLAGLPSGAPLYW